MSAFTSPWAFFYAMIWIPSLIFFVGLQYYSTQAALPSHLKTVKWLCMAVVLTIPVGLAVATDTMLMLIK